VKRVLIITYYWPPAGGPGVQRWLNFVRYLSDFDIEPIVYVPENPNYPIVDEDLLNTVPENVQVVKQPIREPYKLARVFSKKKTKQISRGIISEKNPSSIEKMMLYVRGNYFIPDARIGWVKPSVSFLKEFLNDKSIDAIITTGPPHSLHLIGLRLQKLLKVKWIVDFRDPWTTIHYHKSLRLTKSSEEKHKKLEAEVLQQADHIVVTSKTTRREFSEITKKPITVITNGYEVSETIIPKPDANFTLAHIGSLLSERNPQVLWKVLKELCVENKSFSDKLRIKLVGVVSDDVLQSIKDYGLGSKVELTGYVSHSEAKQMQHNAQVLVLLEIDKPETRAIIPGKLFEYLRASRPIIALGPDGSDIADILKDTRAGYFFKTVEIEAIKEQLLKYFHSYEQSDLSVRSEGIERYNRYELTRTLSDVIKSL
jgi:glycosyltransferase involved in cell wall biosynthesis